MLHSFNFDDDEHFPWQHNCTNAHANLSFFFWLQKWVQCNWINKNFLDFPHRPRGELLPKTLKVLIIIFRGSHDSHGRDKLLVWTIFRTCQLKTMRNWKKRFSVVILPLPHTKIELRNHLLIKVYYFILYELSLIPRRWYFETFGWIGIERIWNDSRKNATKTVDNRKSQNYYLFGVYMFCVSVILVLFDCRSSQILNYFNFNSMPETLKIILEEKKTKEL